MRRLHAYFIKAFKSLQNDPKRPTTDKSIWIDRDLIRNEMLSLLENTNWKFDEEMLNEMFDQEPRFLAEDNNNLFACAEDAATERVLAEHLVALT